VPKYTFISTILFGAKNSNPGKLPHLCDNSRSVLSTLRPSGVMNAGLSTVTKQLICDYAGVRKGSKWKLIKDAAKSLKNIKKGSEPSA